MAVFFYIVIRIKVHHLTQLLMDEIFGSENFQKRDCLAKFYDVQWPKGHSDFSNLGQVMQILYGTQIH